MTWFHVFAAGAIGLPTCITIAEVSDHPNIGLGLGLLWFVSLAGISGYVLP